MARARQGLATRPSKTPSPLRREISPPSSSSSSSTVKAEPTSRAQEPVHEEKMRQKCKISATAPKDFVLRRPENSSYFSQSEESSSNEGPSSSRAGDTAYSHESIVSSSIRQAREHEHRLRLASFFRRSSEGEGSAARHTNEPRPGMTEASASNALQGKIGGLRREVIRKLSGLSHVRAASDPDSSPGAPGTPDTPERSSDEVLPGPFLGSPFSNQPSSRIPSMSRSTTTNMICNRFSHDVEEYPTPMPQWFPIFWRKVCLPGEPVWPPPDWLKGRLNVKNDPEFPVEIWRVDLRASWKKAQEIQEEVERINLQAHLTTLDTPSSSSDYSTIPSMQEDIYGEDKIQYAGFKADKESSAILNEKASEARDAKKKKKSPRLSIKKSIESFRGRTRTVSDTELTKYFAGLEAYLNSPMVPQISRESSEYYAESESSRKSPALPKKKSFLSLRSKMTPVLPGEPSFEKKSPGLSLKKSFESLRSKKTPLLPTEPSFEKKSPGLSLKKSMESLRGIGKRPTISHTEFFQAFKAGAKSPLVPQGMHPAMSVSAKSPIIAQGMQPFPPFKSPTLPWPPAPSPVLSVPGTRPGPFPSVSSSSAAGSSRSFSSRLTLRRKKTVEYPETLDIEVPQISEEQFRAENPVVVDQIRTAAQAARQRLLAKFRMMKKDGQIDQVKRAGLEDSDSESEGEEESKNAEKQPPENVVETKPVVGDEAAVRSRLRDKQKARFAKEIESWEQYRIIGPDPGVSDGEDKWAAKADPLLVPLGPFRLLKIERDKGRERSDSFPPYSDQWTMDPEPQRIDIVTKSGEGVETGEDSYDGEDAVFNEEDNPDDKGESTLRTGKLVLSQSSASASRQIIEYFINNYERDPDTGRLVRLEKFTGEEACEQVPLDESEEDDADEQESQERWVGGDVDHEFGAWDGTGLGIALTRDEAVSTWAQSVGRIGEN